MMPLKTMIFSSLLCLATLTMNGSTLAENQKQVPPPSEAVSEQEIAERLKALVFVPHDTGAPAVTDAGGVRAVTVALRLIPLAPPQASRTLSSTPKLYWYASKPADQPLRLTLRPDDLISDQPLLDVTIDGVGREGIHHVDLDEHGVSLEDGKRYLWSVRAAGQSERDPIAALDQTLMEYSASPALMDDLADAPDEERALRLAGEGYWYDALQVLSEKLDGESGTAWRLARAQLLDQVGLREAAEFDRQQAAE